MIEMKERTQEEIISKYTANGTRKENKSERLIVMITPTMKQALKDISEATGQSMNAIINDLIDNYLINGVVDH